jgi:acetyltransferase
MPIRNLEKLFYPRSVAVIGASNQEGVPGQRVMQNLLQGGFEGPIMPVAPKDQAIAGVLAYPGIESLPITPDLAVVCAPKTAVPDVVRQLGERGARAAILLPEHQASRKPSRPNGEQALLRREVERSGLRILGPDCLGVMVPGIGLNASVAHVPAIPGGIAFVSQSSTICTAVLDWAKERDIGFSYFISLGETVDVDFGDLIDYLGNDPMTRAILVYVESIRSGRTFMSAGRGASRNKPILVIKSGRTAEGQRAVFGDGPSAGSDEVYDAAIRRAGMLRVYSFGELFAAVETLARSKPTKAERLAIVSNGRGIAGLAVDTLVFNGGRLAPLATATEDALDGLVPAGWPRTNPVNLDGNAPPGHYGQVVRLLLRDPHVDAVMVLHAPATGISSTEVAEAVAAAVRETRGTVLTSWMGGPGVSSARRLFTDAGIPTYDTANQAVDAFMHMVRYRRNQDMLMETPASTPTDFTPATEAVRHLIDAHLAQREATLTGQSATAVFSAYGIATAQTRIARTAEDAASVARKMGFPVALRALTADGSPARPADLMLGSSDAVKAAARDALARAAAQAPAAVVQGFTVERMLLKPGAQEVMIRVTADAVFGPVILFGHGGPATDVVADRAVALPPLNMSLARELVSRTRVSRLLAGYGGCPPANLDALCLTLVQISQLIVDIPQIIGLEINPLFVDERGVFAAAGSIHLAPASDASERRLAIRPYPKETEELFQLAGGREVLLRPIRPEDEPAHYEFLSKVTPEDIRLRFFHLIRTMPHAEMARLTQIDYDREMAFIATAANGDGRPETLGVVRTVTDPNNEKAEYAILVRSDLKGQGLGLKLMEKMVRYCRSRGTRRMMGLVLPDNRKMLNMVHGLGFTSRRIPDEDIMEVTLEL